MLFNFSRRTALALALLTSSPLTFVLAEGINCEGNANCGAGDPNALAGLASLINAQGTGWYNNGQQIACDGSICVFLQDSGGAPASSVQPLMNDLVGHGCKICGSVPLFYPQDNNVDDGMVTVNWVSGPCAAVYRTEGGPVMC